MEEKRLRTYSPLTLAFLGDAVYSLFMRSYLVKKGNAPAGKLNRICAKMVSAKVQSEAVDQLLPTLTEEEEDIYRRGKNSAPKNSAKNASLDEYHKATGLESLIGYLYLKEDHGRLEEILKEAVKIYEQGSGGHH